jgi:hypothetical protein
MLYSSGSLAPDIQQVISRAVQRRLLAQPVVEVNPTLPRLALQGVHLLLF